MRKRNLLAVVILFAMLLSGCRLYNVDEIKQHDGLMLVIGTSNQSMVDYSIDSYLGVKYNIYYDGTIERVLMYYLSGDHVVTTTLSDEDLITFYSFCMRYGDGEAFEDYSEEVYDGEHRYYIYYDEEGNYNKIYGGYCYHNETLAEMYDLAELYFEDAERIDWTGSTMVYQESDVTPATTGASVSTNTATPTLTTPPLPTSSEGSLEPLDIFAITSMPYDDALTSEENLNNYYEQILVPELGEIESSEQTFDVVSVWEQGIILYPQVDMYGIALTYTADINADELPEMLVFRYERRRDESRSLDFNELHMSVASINDGSIYISDDIALDDYYASQIYSNNLKVNYTTVALMLVDNQIGSEIIVNHYSGGNYYSDGWYASGYLYRLAEDNTIRPVSSAVQNGEGSDDITGIVTEYDQYGNVISEEDRGGEWPYFFTPDSWYEERGIILTTDASESDINFENAEVIYRSIFDFNHDYDNPQFILNIRGE